MRIKALDNEWSWINHPKSCVALFILTWWTSQLDLVINIYQIKITKITYNTLVPGR